MKKITRKNLVAIERVSFSREERGITLVALIITVIVLIIMSAVTIITLTETGILQTASKGTENYVNAQEYEKQIMNNIDEKAKNVVKNIIVGSGGTETNPGGEENPPVPEGPEMPKGWNRNKVYAYESKDGIVIPVPIGFAVSEIESEKSVNRGIVIYDIPEEEREGIDWTADVDNSGFLDVQERYNQFVWVPVPNTSEMFGVDKDGNNLGKLYSFNTSGASPLNWTEIEDENGNKVMSWISNTSHREPDVVSDDKTKAYYADAGIKDKDGNTIMTFEAFKLQLQEEFKMMKESVEKYNGFYIGRYETGDLSKEKAKVSKNNSDIDNQNWYSMYQKNKTIVEEKSSMIWGCQWDAVMKWFLNSEYSDTRTYVISSKENKQKGNYSNSKISTGSNDNYFVNNIYDMAGNMFDYTIQATENDRRVSRRLLV